VTQSDVVVAIASINLHFEYECHRPSAQTAFSLLLASCLKKLYVQYGCWQWETVKAGQGPRLPFRSSEDLFPFPYLSMPDLSGGRVPERGQIVALHYVFVRLQTGYPMLKICPTAFPQWVCLWCLGVNTGHGKGNEKSQTEEGKGVRIGKGE